MTENERTLTEISATLHEIEKALRTIATLICMYGEGQPKAAFREYGGGEQ